MKPLRFINYTNYNEGLWVATVVTVINFLFQYPPTSSVKAAIQIPKAGNFIG